MADSFIVPGVNPPFGIFSHAAWVPKGRPLFISGIVPQNEHGEVVGEGDIEAQTRQTLLNIKKVLDHCGGTFDDIVVVNVFIRDMSGLDVIHQVRSGFFNEPYPASTLVQVEALVDPRYLIEINAFAVIPE